MIKKYIFLYMNNDTKIKFITNNIDNIGNSIYKIILDNNIPYTKNNNGIFINLSKLDEDIINIIYGNIKNNDYNDIDIEKNNNIKIYKKIINNKIVIHKKQYLKFENLDDNDIELIKYSKKI